MSKQLDRIRRNARANLYFVSTSTGYWAAYNAETCTQVILSRNEKEARVLFERILNPPREKLPYRPSLSDQIEAEAKKQASPPKRACRNYTSVASRLREPEIAAIFAGVTAHDNHYFKEGEAYHLSKILSKVTTSASKWIDAAWKLGMLEGEQPTRVPRKRHQSEIHKKEPLP